MRNPLPQRCHDGVGLLDNATRRIAGDEIWRVLDRRGTVQSDRSASRRPGLSVKVPRLLKELKALAPLPLSYHAAEQFLGAYEFGALRVATPIASGDGLHEAPAGEFRLPAAHRQHQSCLYMIEGTDRPYPMNYALRFHVNREGVS